MSQAYLSRHADELGPEALVFVYDPETGMKGVLVLDNTVLGPAGGGVRMLPDVSEAEVAGLARAMTYKFGIYGLPRGGCKAGIWGDPAMPAAQKQQVMRAFGSALRPYLEPKLVTVGPDMGVGIDDLTAIYEGAGADYPRSGLFQQVLEQDALEFHLTGYGVIIGARAAFKVQGRSMEGATVAIEGFGHVGVGAARYAVREGAKVVAVSTVHGGLYDEGGLDVERLMALRREHGDQCLAEYKAGKRISTGELFFLPVDLLVPGARPYVIDEKNQARVQARFISSGGNIPITQGAEALLFDRGVLSVPDFIANGGGVIASWVDYLGGSREQGFRAIEGMIEGVTTKVLEESLRSRTMPRTVAEGKVAGRIRAQRHQPRKTWDEVREEIRAQLSVF
jgi:glutamate dehydrogenase (NAD(P)+)